MALCSSCNTSTLLVGGLQFDKCNHVICSFCGQDHLPRIGKEKNGSLQQIPCPSKCGSFVTRDEIALLLEEVRSGQFMAVNKVALSRSIARNSSKSVPKEQITLLKGSTDNANSVEGATSLLASASLDDKSSGRAHQNKLIQKMVETRKMTLDQATLAVSKLALIETQESISCQICLTDDVPPGEGIVLKQCLHFFCKSCISGHISSTDSAQIQCPFVNDTERCEMTLLPSEVEALVSQAEYERHFVHLWLQETEESLPDMFHCQTPDCRGFCMKEDATRHFFRCPVCSAENCLKCKALHNRRTSCEAFRQNLENEEKRRNEQLNEKTINEYLSNKIYMKCPSCSYVIEKNGGCPHMTCKKCKHEFQWTGVMD